MYLAKKINKKHQRCHWFPLTKLWPIFLTKQPHLEQQKKAKTSHHISGVIILEYALLLISCVLLALIIAKVVTIGNTPDEHGWIVQKWVSVIQVIAEDI